MPTITEPTTKKGKASKKATSMPSKKVVGSYLLTALCGGVLGLSAPGIEQWYIAWFALAPLLISIGTSAGLREAFMRGLIFGTAYNLVYANFLLGLQPLNWLGFNEWQGWLLAGAAWFIAATHQGLITGLFAALCRFVPMIGGFAPKKSSGSWALPALLTIPLLWVVIHHLVGNHHDALGIPWTMLEYSQYRMHNVIQVASAIGGIGICFLIVMCNTAVASMACSLWKKKAKMLACASKEHAFYELLFTAAILTGFMGLGFYMESQVKVVEDIPASVVQGNINIDMQKTTHRYTLEELLIHYKRLVRSAPAGICVMSENSLPVYLRSDPAVEHQMAQLAKQQHLDLVIGAMDQSAIGPYNSAYGFRSSGDVIGDVYHKRYLVPFGEYTPWLVQYFPEWIKRLTNTPAGAGFNSGRQPVVLNFERAAVAPLICFETLSPELASSSVRAGGQLLVNVSDLAWFHDSIIGKQMIAFSVLRAVENRRDFIFAANTGPSAIIDAHGKIRQISSLDKAEVLTGKIGLNTQLTPFTRWFLF